MATITLDGKFHPVTDAWAAANIDPWPDLATQSIDWVDGERRRVANLSNDRRLTTGERAYLRVLDNHFNARNAVRVLGWPDLADFGFTGVDQLHGQRATLACGCELNQVFDHHLAMAKSAAADVLQPDTKATAISEATLAMAGLDTGEAAVIDALVLTLHPHTPGFLCEAHAPLADGLSLADLHTRVVADNEPALG